MTALAGRGENTVQVLILLATGGTAAAASFTHMHDWTMANVPAGTGDWFGWANAVVADLIPMAAALEVRRRRRAGQPTGYPLAVLVGFALLSLAAQVACAKPSASGWLLASVPALGFLALTKLVLSRTPAFMPADQVVDPGATDMALGTDMPPDTALVAPNTSSQPVSLAPQESPQRPREAPDTAVAVARLATRHPDMPAAEIARRVGVSDRTVRRYLADLRGTTVVSADPTPAAA